MYVSVTKRRTETPKNEKNEKLASKVKEEPNVNYEYFDPGNHWCRVCNQISTNIFDVFAHLHSKKHQQVRLNSAVWHVYFLCSVS